MMEVDTNAAVNTQLIHFWTTFGDSPNSTTTTSEPCSVEEQATASDPAALVDLDSENWLDLLDKSVVVRDEDLSRLISELRRPSGDFLSEMQQQDFSAAPLFYSQQDDPQQEISAWCQTAASPPPPQQSEVADIPMENNASLPHLDTTEVCCFLDLTPELWSGTTSTNTAAAATPPADDAFGAITPTLSAARGGTNAATPPAIDTPLIQIRHVAARCLTNTRCFEFWNSMALTVSCRHSFSQLTDGLAFRMFFYEKFSEINPLFMQHTADNSVSFNTAVKMDAMMRMVKFFTVNLLDEVDNDLHHLLESNALCEYSSVFTTGNHQAGSSTRLVCVSANNELRTNITVAFAAHHKWTPLQVHLRPKEVAFFVLPASEVFSVKSDSFFKISIKTFIADNEQIFNDYIDNLETKYQHGPILAFNIATTEIKRLALIDAFRDKWLLLEYIRNIMFLCGTSDDYSICSTKNLHAFSDCLEYVKHLDDDHVADVLILRFHS